MTLVESIRVLVRGCPHDDIKHTRHVQHLAALVQELQIAAMFHLEATSGNKTRSWTRLNQAVQDSLVVKYQEKGKEFSQ